MRIKFLSVIVSFLLVSFAITSCLDNNEATGDYSTDATIHAFAIDTVFGVDYKFTINQIAGQIYNLDSLPVGSDTIIDRVLIKTLTTTSGIVTMLNKAGEDSVINIADSMDLRKPIDVKVWSAEGYVMLTQGASKLEYGKFVKDYRLEVRVHKQDPDTLNWGSLKDEKPIATNFGAITGQQKAVIRKDAGKEEIFVYSKTTSNTLVAYKASTTDGTKWESVGEIQGLPIEVDLSSILSFENSLYALSQGIVYLSTDAKGAIWTQHETLNDRKVMALLASFPDKGTLNDITGISAIVADATTDATTYKFAMTNKTATSWKEIGEEVPSDFPRTNISSTVYTTSIGIQAGMLMGSGVMNPKEEEATLPIAPWGFTSRDNTNYWTDLSTVNAFCPILTLPSIMHYGDDFYAFGNDFATFYASANGIAWYESGKKFYFPTGLKARAGSDYSMVVDSQNFIWIICSQSSNGNTEVWRARLNKLGFKNAVKQ